MTENPNSTNPSDSGTPEPRGSEFTAWQSAQCACHRAHALVRMMKHAAEESSYLHCPKPPTSVVFSGVTTDLGYCLEFLDAELNSVSYEIERAGSGSERLVAAKECGAATRTLHDLVAALDRDVSAAWSQCDPRADG